ncbi:hypothetical protein Acor_62850 [Acrocarpospora corrugata]|uniref:Uncharacterized protein n=1 Tax=Acrocarpospora corrugata TaxID=35763 RepID=A0A5M3W576_9ACTN|nr:hypothetical protein [Acrocarpospora corrugata]GES04217.1 hypothetical protein Acor_62850 [Acrocarpospora corrugata]
MSRTGWYETQCVSWVAHYDGAGGNPHTLVADPRTCRWTTGVADRSWLAIGVFETSAVAYLLHPEHGASGCAPGSYVVRRQREHNGREARLVVD